MKTDQAAVRDNSRGRRSWAFGWHKELSGAVRGALFFIVCVTALPLLAPAAFGPATLAFSIKLFLSGLILRVLYICFPRRERIHELGATIADKYSSLANFQKLYVNACVVSTACILIGWMGGRSFLRIFVLVALVSWGSVVFRDVLRWYKILSEHLVGKAAIGIAFVVASTVAYSLAGQEITSVVHVTPTNFTHAILFIAIAMIPVLLIFAGAIVSFVCLLMSALVMSTVMLGKPARQAVQWLLAGALPGSDIPYAAVTRIFQVFFYGTVGMLVYTQGQRVMPAYDREISRAATWLVFNFDMFYGKECKLGEGYRLAPLGDAKFLIAKKSPDGEISIEPPVKCDDLPLR